MSTNALPVYDPNEPYHPQENDWDCSVESTEWALYSWGRSPADDWIEQSMIDAGVVDPAVGLCDASGAGLAAWVNQEYGEYGHVASNQNPVSFDDLAAEAATLSHPIMAGGRSWYHWTGVRGYDARRGVLLLANPAPGWMGIYQELSRADFERLGSWSMVRLTHPAAEGADPPSTEVDYTPWEGYVGSGLLELMKADDTVPAQAMSTWLPLGAPAADVEQCYGENGTLYSWLLNPNRGYRHPPA